MSKKVLTETELKKILREVVTVRDLYKAGHLTNEGAWDWIKHKLGKMGSLEKGGKILGRGKAAEEAEAELQAILDKADKASDRTIKALYNDIQEKYPEFPNQKDPKEYALALTDVYIFYDSLVQAAKKKPGEKGAFPCAAANELITDLRKVVKKWTDYDLADVYKHLTEEQKRLLAEAAGDDELLDELFGSKEKKWDKIDSGELDVDEKGRTFKPGDAAPGASAGEQGKSSRLGGGELSTIDGLKSNLLPGALGLAGGAALIAAYIASQPAFVNWLAGKLGAGQGLNPKALTTEIGGAVDKTIGPLNGEGFTQMFGRLTGIQGPGQQMFQAGDPVSNLFEEFGKYGINPKNPTALFELGVDKASYMERLASGATTIGEMFPASDKGLWLKLGKKTSVTVAKAITKKVVQGAGSATAATALATGTAAAAGPLLAGLGIALVTSAAAIKLIRMKGLQSSRAKSLKVLFDALVPVDCEDGPQPPPPGECSDEEKEQGKVWNPDTEECECPEGMVFSEKAGRCIKDEDVVENCGYMGLKDGTNPETGEPGCVCPDTGKFVPTEHWDDWQETGWCKDDDEEGKCSDEEVAQGKEWNEADQVCACPEGQTFNDETGKCEEDEGEGNCSDEQTAAGMVWRDDLDPPQCACPPGSKFDKETQKCVEDKKSKRLKPILIKLDNDALEKDSWKLYSTTIRSDKAGEKWNDLFSGVQKQGIMGRDALEELLAVTDGELLDEAEGDDEGGMETQYSDAFETQQGKGRIRRQRMSPRSIRGNLNKLRKRYGDNLKVYYAFDGSLYSDLEEVGIDKSAAQKIASNLLKTISKDNELPPLDQKEVLRALGRRKPKTVYKIMRKYLVSPEPQKKMRESNIEELQEALTLARWKVLSGIK